MHHRYNNKNIVHVHCNYIYIVVGCLRLFCNRYYKLRNCLAMPRSCHPRHCKTAIPFSQALRLRRICSEQDNLVMRSQELKHYLMKRGYPEQLLDTEIHRAINTPREDSLLRGNRGRKEQRIPLVVTYHPSMNFLARTHQTPPNYFAKLGTSERDF